MPVYPIPDRWKAVARARAAGMSYRQIATIFGVSRDRIRQIVQDYEQRALWGTEQVGLGVSRCPVSARRSNVVAMHHEILGEAPHRAL